MEMYVNFISVAAEMCLVSHYLAVAISEVLLWLHTSSVHVSCHNIVEQQGKRVWKTDFSEGKQNACCCAIACMLFAFGLSVTVTLIF
jgi:hypothetical protein